MENFSTVKIKQISNPDNPELGIKYVGAKEYATPKVGRDGKVITGLDEFALDLTQLPNDEFKAQSKKIKALRENLEKVLGIDLSTTSPYWNDFYIVLEDEITLDPLNSMDKLKEVFLVANRYVAPSLDHITEDENFQNCLFYIYKEEVEVSKKAKQSLDKDKAISKLVHLHDENPHKLKIIASHIFKFDASSDISSEDAYVRLRQYLDDEKEGKKHIETFLRTYEKPQEEMMTMRIFETAVRKKFITKKAGIYRRGEVEYGASVEDATQFLMLPENSGEVGFLQKLVTK